MPQHLPIKKLLFTAAILVAMAVCSIAIAHEGEAHGDQPAQPPLSYQDKRVVNMLEKYAKAVQTANIAEIEKYFITSDVFSSLEGTSQDLGWESYRKHLAAELPMFNDTNYSLSNIRPYVSGNLAFATMDFFMEVTIKSDKFAGGQHKVEMNGKATMVLSESNNEWKILHMHTSREPANNSGAESKSH